MIELERAGLKLIAAKPPLLSTAGILYGGLEKHFHCRFTINPALAELRKIR